MQAPGGYALKKKLVELLIAWRLEPLSATRSQPAVLGSAMHGAEHVSRAKRRKAPQPVAMRRMVEACDVK